MARGNQLLSPLGTAPNLEALKTKEKYEIYIYTYIYLCTYLGQSDLLVLDNKPYKEMYDLSVFI